MRFGIKTRGNTSLVCVILCYTSTVQTLHSSPTSIVLETPQSVWFFVSVPRAITLRSWIRGWAVWCSVVQCAAVCCSVLHCVALCCSDESNTQRLRFWCPFYEPWHFALESRDGHPVIPTIDSFFARRLRLIFRSSCVWVSGIHQTF